MSADFPLSFIWPAMLLSMLSIPLLVVFYILIQMRRRRYPARYGDLGFVQEAGGRPLGLRRHVPAMLFLVGLLLLTFTMARPQMVVNLPRLEGTLILAFDVSGSMAADDLKPTRMEAAKASARAFVDRQPPGVLIGIVTFSDSGFTVQAPTTDRDAIFATINRLAPQRGTSLAHGILTSLNTIAAGSEQSTRFYSDLTPAPTPTPTPVPRGTYSPAAIVLLTDGENNVAPDPIAAALAAADRGVRIYPIGIGSTAGATLEIEGFIVHSQLDENLLQRIAALTGGAYYTAEDEQDLQMIYENLSPELVVKPDRMEITSILAGASMLILLTGGALSFLWFNRFP